MCSLDKLVLELRRKLEKERAFAKDLEALCAAKDAVIQAGQVKIEHLGGLVNTLEKAASSEEEARSAGRELHRSRARLAKATKLCQSLGIDYDSR